MNNPFTSVLFVDKWSKHFNGSGKSVKFQFINGVQFYKSKFFPIYINIGKNLTKGISYSLNYQASDFKNKVFLIYDVPQFFDIEPFDDSRSALAIMELIQYQGFLLDFRKFPTAQDYINSRLSSKNKRGLRSRQDRLEKCFNITYKFYTNDITKSEFDLVFQQFHTLLSNRFLEKKVNYHHLNSEKWAFHREFSYAMMMDGKASLFVIYDGKMPIAVTLSIHSNELVFVAITVFDPDYYKFNLGKTTIVKLIEWCYENNMKIADFSKGDFEFKHVWCNVVYDFHYHLLYDSNSVKAKITAKIIAMYFEAKRYLRKKNANKLYRKLLYKINNKPNHSLSKQYTIEELEAFSSNGNHEKINIDKDEYMHLKKFVYSFMFLNGEPSNEINVYISKNNKKDYFIEGSEKTQKISFN